jgi:hypothetical protein
MDDIVNTIELLASKVKAKEDEANKLKHVINDLCTEAGIPVRYGDIIQAGSISSIRADQFYGLPLTAAIRQYLEIRKAAGLGAAAVIEIFRAIKDGGYKFDTKSDDNARIGVGNALRKTSAIFHRLPNGQYGLLSWYPSAKAPAESVNERKTIKRLFKRVKKLRESAQSDVKSLPSPPGASSEATGEGETITNQDIRNAVAIQPGEFQGSDIEKAIRDKFPSKIIPTTKIPTVLFLLKKEGVIKIATPRSGKKGATFERI